MKEGHEITNQKFVTSKRPNVQPAPQKPINMKKILNYTDRICLFCGIKIKQQWDECETYYECDCNDAKKTRQIKKQIKDLAEEMPEDKFVINSERVLRKLN